MSADSIVVDIHIGRQEWLEIYYDGAGRNLRVRARDGRSVVFPARILHPWITHDGVKGTFMILFDRHGKFHSASKLA
ncbi:MAG: DUF2835 family protein [Oleiphilaceae bacterium]|nr:DUF2835 family protein [Oleiphilaceae bacterium]